MDETITFSWSFVLEFIIASVIIGIFIFFMYQGSITDIADTYMERASANGGFTEQDIINLKAELVDSGYEADKLTIKIQAFDGNGLNISNKVYPITPKKQTPYPSSPNFVPREGKIVLSIISSQEATINESFRLIDGTPSNIKHQIRRTAMSERTK